MSHPAFHIRPYRDSDERDIVALWGLCFPGGPARNDPQAVIARKSKVQPELFLVGLRGPRLIATALAGFDGHRGWVYRVATHPDHRHRGYARRMMAEVEQRLSALGCPKLNLQVYADNSGVVAFYERLGYAVEQRINLGKVLTRG